LPTGEPEKTTTEVDFTAALEACVEEDKREVVEPLLAELTSARRAVLWSLDKDRTLVTTEEICEKVRLYLSLLRGFRAPPGTQSDNVGDIAEAAVPATFSDKQAADSAAESKDGAEANAEDKGAPAADAAAGLPVPPETVANAEVDGVHALPKRNMMPFVWRDIMDTDGDDFTVTDTMLEEACVLLAAAQRLLTKAASQPLTTDSINGTYAMLRSAAGILEQARKVAGESRVPPENLPEDLRTTLPEAWNELALSQAQHCTLFRACSQSHIGLPLIGQLCQDTARRYDQPLKRQTERLTTSNSSRSAAQWAGKIIVQRMLTAHCEFKALYFRALARYCTAGERLKDPNIDDTSCVMALKSLNQAMVEFEECERKATAFLDIAKSIVFIGHMKVHTKTQLDECKSILRKQLEYADQLNNSVFYKPQPAEPEELPTPVSMLSAVPFDMPAPHPLWTKERWEAFDQTKAPDLKAGKTKNGNKCCVIN